MANNVAIYPSLIDEETQKMVIPEYEIVLETNSVTVSDVFQIMERMSYFREHPNDKELLLSTYYYKKIMESFEKNYGKIKYMDISIKHQYLIILTKDKLFHLVETDDLPTAQFLYQCDKLRAEAYQHLQSVDQSKQKLNKVIKKETNVDEGSVKKIDERDKILVEKDELFLTLDQICTLISHCFSSLARLKDKKITQEKHVEVIDYLLQEYQKIYESFIQRANRISLLSYYLGMIRGVSYVGVMALSCAAILMFMKASNSLIITLSGSLFIGAIGAIISVFSRMSSRTFSLDYTAGIPQNMRLGVFRPIIGSTMGIVTYLLLMSGLTPFEVPVGNTTQIYYILSIAFSAGFTERWAQGLLPGKGKDESSEYSNTNMKKEIDVIKEKIIKLEEERDDKKGIKSDEE